MTALLSAEIPIELTASSGTEYYAHQVLTREAQVQIIRPVGEYGAANGTAITSILLGAAVSSGQVLPAWADDAVDALESVAGRPWLLGGNAVYSPAAHTASNLLRDLARSGVPAPQVNVGTDGGIVIEWHDLDIDVEIYVIGDGTATISIVDDKTALDTDEPVVLSAKHLQWIASRLS